ncbi:hypothetical protein HDU88_000628, partial [Geranomyces variabilis]
MCPSDDLLFSRASAPYNIFPKKARRLRPPSTRCSARDFQDLHLHVPYLAETWVVEPSSESKFIFVRRIEICNESHRRHLYIAVDRHLDVAYECFESRYGDSSNTLRFREHSPFSENLPSLLGCTTISQVFTAFESAFPGFRRKGYIDAEEVSIYEPPDTYVLTPDERERFALALPKTVPPALREFSDLMGIPQCERFITAFVPRWLHRAGLRHAERVILCDEAQAKLCLLPILFAAATQKEIEIELPGVQNWVLDNVTYTAARLNIVDLRSGHIARIDDFQGWADNGQRLDFKLLSRSANILPRPSKPTTVFSGPSSLTGAPMVEDSSVILRMTKGPLLQLMQELK